MMLRILFLLTCVIFSSSILKAREKSIVRGIVFLDANGNGKMESDEPGLNGICVSNGKEVVQTAADGKWELTNRNTSSVFVIKPPHYAVLLNENNIPQHFSDVSTGVDVNIPLVPTAEDSVFSVLFFGDTQARGLREVNFILHDVVEECLESSAAFGVSLGDIVADDPNLFAEVSQGIGQIGIPWYYIFGNHDHDRDESENVRKDKTFRKFFGPSTYALEYGQVVFIGLNNIYFNAEGKYSRHLSESQLEFVENYLRFVPEDKLIVLMMHAPVVRTENRDKLYEILRNRTHTFSISGHVHEQMHVFVDEEMGWKGKDPHHHLINATVCGSWWCGVQGERGIPHATMNDGAPNGYTLISFNENKYSIRFKAACRPENYQMNIYLPDELNLQQLDTTRVLANVFAGSSRSKVEMRVGKSNHWVPMEQESTIDPDCLRMHLLNPYLELEVEDQELEEVFGFKMDYPSITSHMWSANLPSGLPEGTHTLTIRTTDMFNQTWTGHRIFRIRSGE